MQHTNIAQNHKSCQASRLALKFACFLTVAGVLFLSPLAVSAARITATGEKSILSESRLVMEPGEVKTVKVGFKNTKANLIWRKQSKNYASLYAVGPRGRKSAFNHKSWIAKDHVARITEKEIRNGQIAFVEFKLQAPAAAGEYIEDFGLALENLAWVDGAIFELKIRVEPKGTKIKEATKNNKNLASPHEALLLLTSHRSLTLKTREEAVVKFGFKNTGKTAWNNRGLKSLAGVRIASTESSPTSDWFSSEIPVSIKNQQTKPGELGFIDLPLRAPQKGGQYTLQLALVVDDQVVNGGEIELPVEVIEEAETLPLLITEFTPVIEEPIIRIGLEQNKLPILITADQNYEIKDGSGNSLGIVGSGVVSIVRFDNLTKIYSVETGSISYSGPNYLRFLPTVPGAIFEIKSMERFPYFSREINDNKFRGALEVRLSQVDNLWLINELKLEDYLRGLAEARNSAPLEFQKAQATAARSFAYYNVANGGKYKKGYFDLTWTPDDQVYRGYNSELRMQNLVRGAEETRGIFVAYDGKVVTTPYFAQSNGKTKRWPEVWGGRDRPWLQSVAAPFDEGKKQRGHGVGMSQLDAIWRADQGANYEEILKYYYQGIELKRLY